jgi:hypothetical protein
MGLKDSIHHYQLTIQELEEENKKLQLTNQLYLKKIKARNKKIRELEFQLNHIHDQLSMKQEQENVKKNNFPTALKESKIVFPEKKKIQKPLNEKSVKNEEVRKLQNQTIENNSLRKLAFVTKLPLNHKLLSDPNKHLIKESIKLAVYSDPFLKNQSGYAVIQVLTDKQSGKTYLLESEIGSLKKKLGSKWPDIRAHNEMPQIVKQMNLNNFAWPSTELKGGYSVDEKSSFKEESELKMLGYQITGMTREKRWKVLETAVKQLGLKKVAYTIAQNVKLRKGQKDGLKKFSFAIGEWEYDLNKLKQTYYRNDFSWPLT